MMKIKLNKPIFFTIPSFNETIKINGGLRRAGMMIDTIEVPESLYNKNSNTAREEYLRYLVYKGFKERYPNTKNEKITKRLEEEIKIIVHKNWIEYFLVLHSLIEKIKQFTDYSLFTAYHRALFSMVNYCLYITNTDPIKFELQYENFLKYKELIVSIWVNESEELKKWFEKLNKIYPQSYEEGKSIPPIGNAKVCYIYEDFREAEKIVIMAYDKEQTNIPNMIKGNIKRLKK